MNWLGRPWIWLRLAITDIGTVLLGAAAIFLARAIPSDSLNDFEPGLTVLAVICCALGLVWRSVSRP